MTVNSGTIRQQNSILLMGLAAAANNRIMYLTVNYKQQHDIQQQYNPEQ